jgi:CTP:molybdopterin cytidylyltransferase MocA
MIAAVILAAGSGRRMGGPKALLEVEGETLLVRAARAALQAGAAPVVAVVGDWTVDLAGLPVQTVLNPEAAEGMASSIRTGIAALPETVEGALILPVDMPEVDADLLARLLALATLEPDRPAACAYAGTLGIPAVLPRRLFHELRNLEGDRGAKAILLREQAASLPFPEGNQDLDTPTDLERFRR